MDPFGVFFDGGSAPTDDVSHDESSSSSSSSGGEVDLSAQLSSASSSFWGFVSSASESIKKTTASVVSEVRRDFNEFSQSLVEENETSVSSAAAEEEGEKTSGAPSLPIGRSPSPSNTVTTAGSSIASPSSVGSPHRSASSDLTASASGEDWGSRMLDGVERLGDNMLEKAIHMLPKGIWTFGTDEEEQAKQTDATTTEVVPSQSSATPQAEAPTSARNAKLLQMQMNPSSYTTDPVDASGQLSSEYRAFSQHFHADYESMWKEELETKIIPSASSTVREMYRALAADDDDDEDAAQRIPAKIFWCRYLFRVRVIEAEESRRTSALLGQFDFAPSATAETKQTNSDADDNDEPAISTDDGTSEKFTTADDSSSAAAVPGEKTPSEEVPVEESKPTEEPTPIATPSPRERQTDSINVAAPPRLIIESPECVSTSSASPLAAEAAPIAEPAAVPAPTAAVDVVSPTSSTSSASESASESAAIATASVAAPKRLETKEAMRARLESEARERVQKKLAEKKAAKEAAAAAATAGSSSASATLNAMPPTHPITNSQSAEQMTILSPLFSEIITKSVPTNTTPEPLRRTLAAQARAAAAAANAAQPTEVVAPGSPLSASSRSSSQSSSNGWENIDDAAKPATATTITVTAPSSTTTAAADIAPPATTNTTANKEDDTWEWE